VEHLVKRTLLLTLALTAFAVPAWSQPAASSAGDFTRGYGMGWESFETPIEASTRDESGNRTIVNGRMEIEGTLTGGLMDNYGSGLGAQAIGNQLNVVTQGNYNTVIVDSTQINNGDISAVAGDR
jgi:holdfast attachment protein HfaA